MQDELKKRLDIVCLCLEYQQKTLNEKERQDDWMYQDILIEADGLAFVLSEYAHIHS